MTLTTKTQAVAIAFIAALSLALGAWILTAGKAPPLAEEPGHAPAAGHADDRPPMSDEQLAAAGITLAAAGPAAIATPVDLLGEVRYNGDRTVQVVPRLAGLVESVAANAGDRVRKGQVLAVLSSQALADLRSDLLAAQRRQALARSTRQRERTLWEEKISAHQDLLQAEATLQEADIAVQRAQQKLASLGGVSSSGPLTRFELRSPIDGVVTDKQLSVGQSLADDAVVFTVSDLGSVWVEAPVPARSLGAVAAGSKARVRATAFEAQAEGRIAHVSEQVGEQTRSATARLVLPNPAGLWRPGLPVTVTVTTDEREAPVTVLADAVHDLHGGPVVFVRDGERFDARTIEPGRSDGRWVEVRSGLKAGERYAAKNSFVVKAELGKAGADHEH